MLLGEVLAQLSDEASAAEALLALDDLPLLGRVRSVGSAFGENPGVYAAGAARRFAQLATDDDWLALMTALRAADDPGSACLRGMLDWSLHRDTEDGEPARSCACGKTSDSGDERH